jgi:hypothetical protein
MRFRIMAYHRRQRRLRLGITRRHRHTLRESGIARMPHRRAAREPVPLHFGHQHQLDQLALTT